MGKRRNWIRVHEDWLDSGQTITAYCRANNISTSGFYAGVQRHNLSTTRGSESSTLLAAPGFVKAVISSPPQTRAAVIEMPNGITIKLDQIDGELIYELAKISGGR